MTDNYHIAPAQDVHAYALDDETLVFQARSGRIFRLNATPSVIWQGISAGVPMPEIISALAGATASCSDRIATDVHRLVSHWKELAILGGGDSETSPSGAENRFFLVW